MESKTGPDRQTLDALPSLPQVLLRILDAVTHDPADFSRLARVIRQDTAISARLITIANSSYYRRQHSCDTVEAALSYLGMETVRTLVITAAVKQYFGHFDQQHRALMRRFWLRSLVSANCAQALASLTNYPPAEAYLCGLLVDVGQLWLLCGHEDYAPLMVDFAGDDRGLLDQEQQQFATTHCESGASLVESWRMDNFMAEALRFHHAPLADVRQGHHLVKIINLASELSAQPQPSEAALAKADALFGLGGELTGELRRRIDNDVQAIADDLGIRIDAPAADESDSEAHRRLGDRLSEITQLQLLGKRPATAPSKPDSARALFLGLGIDRHLMFFNRGGIRLEASTGTGAADFIIDAETDSLVNQCFASNSATASAPGDALATVDRQLLGYCRQPRLLCLPFSAGDRRGVLVAGADDALVRDQLRKPEYWQSLLNDAASLALPVPSADTRQAPVQSDDTEPSAEQRRIREAVHEISNPLSIINNYLEMLRVRFGGQEGTAEDLAILREEIERIGKILLRLKEPDHAPADQAVDINRIIRDISRIFEQSLCLTRGIHTELELTPEIPPLTLEPAAFKQVLSNLLKNAVEAMPAGGRLCITSTRVNSNGRQFIGVTVRDSGGGIDAGVMARLFQPVPSSKGADHAGLGLSIVRKLMDSMGAQIYCSSDSNGTEFRLLFPVGEPA